MSAGDENGGKVKLTVIIVAVAVGLLAMAAGVATEPGGARVTAASSHFMSQSGKGLYMSVCRGCHMSNGQGATGAGSYPSLRKDLALGNAVYPIYIVLNGRRAMPGFRDYLSDKQIAAIVNYVRTHFGNDDRPAVTARDVRPLRAQSIAQTRQNANAEGR
jgi:mono/diheme cytochrome c family protein